MTNATSHRSPHATPPARLWCRDFPARPEQVGQARKFLAAALLGCPIADDALLCLSELASNSVLHSASRRPGGAFTVRAEIRHDDYVRIEVRDEGGPWDERPCEDGRAHGLQVIEALTGPNGWGVEVTPDGGRVVWARLGLAAGE